MIGIPDKILLHVMDDRSDIRYLDRHLGVSRYAVLQGLDELKARGLIAFISGETKPRVNRESLVYHDWFNSLSDRLNGETAEYGPIVQREQQRLAAYAH